MTIEDPLSTDAEPAPHPADQAAARSGRRARCAQPAELSAAGLTWIHLDAPTSTTREALAERFGWHALDVEDVLSKRQRPKVDDYPTSTSSASSTSRSTTRRSSA